MEVILGKGINTKNQIGHLKKNEKIRVGMENPVALPIPVVPAKEKSNTCFCYEDCYLDLVAIFLNFTVKIMHLYIKTPLYENNKYVPHLLEHCVLFSADREELFSYFVDIEAYTAYGHTCFEFSKPLVIANIVDKIRKPISKESYLFQKKVIANEIKEISNDKKWREKAYQYLIKNPEIRTNNIPKGVSLATLHDYQQLRYQEKNMIFV
ncbi:MAG: hypothetical protein LBO09_02505 [Candidatus Peribacteria bacterium]|jgi:hypothetical protein|nr:hypothetical protein [Candidatus Peribacteria bacterium]